MIEGGLVEVQQFHPSRLSLLNVDIYAVGLAVAQDKVVFDLGELAGNIWMAELKEEQRRTSMVE